MLDVTSRLLPNRLLAGLAESQLARLSPHLEPVDLPLGMMLEPAHEPIAFVYFPASGLTSTVAREPGGGRIEVGIIGREGMTGLPVLMGDDRSPNETQMQVAGTGHRLPADALRAALAAEPALRERFLRYAHTFVIQASQTALANGKHTIEQRLARWLVMCQDRVESEQLPLTHEFLSIMLGVRRAGVTIATHMLEGRGLIRARRGCIRIRDRAGLEAEAGGSYGIPEAEYARLMGAPASVDSPGILRPIFSERGSELGPRALFEVRRS
jgi:CRP-like cAMP-binding protein